jgi:hypothetical protein
VTWPIEFIGSNGRRVSYSEAEARAALAGYAFGQVDLSWKPPSGLPPESGLGVPPGVGVRYRWGYWSFDCAPASPHLVSIEDIAATAALNTGVSGDAVLGLYAIRHDLNKGPRAYPGDDDPSGSYQPRDFGVQPPALTPRPGGRGEHGRC